MSTSIRACNCVHPGQDRLYGQGMRLHNLAKKGSAWRCTVCGTTKDLSKAAPAPVAAAPAESNKPKTGGKKQKKP